MQIVRVDRLIASDLEYADLSYCICEVFSPPFDGPALGPVIPVRPYRKGYPVGERIAEADRTMLAIATLIGQNVGYVAASLADRDCVQIDALAVCKSHRRAGVARQLMDEAVAWARDMGAGLLSLESQSTNVPAGRFYERYGFRLYGCDRHTFADVPAHARQEVALLWSFDLS